MSPLHSARETDRRAFLNHLAGLGAAALAGRKHYYAEQDTAPPSGDSIAAAAKSYEGLMRALS